jgi:hypothetical protein
LLPTKGVAHGARVTAGASQDTPQARGGGALTHWWYGFVAGHPVAGVFVGLVVSGLFGLAALWTGKNRSGLARIGSAIIVFVISAAAFIALPLHDGKTDNNAQATNTNTHRHSTYRTCS